MVAINKLSIIGTLAIAVAASPIAQPETTTQLNILDEANALAAALAVMESTSTSEEAQIFKRDLQLGPVATLLANVGQFLGSTVQNLLTLNLAKESTALAQLLANVNKFLLNLEAALIQFTPQTGLGGALQHLLIGTGLQSLVLGLTTIVSSLVAFLIGNGKIDPAVQAQIKDLNDHIKAISDGFQKTGYSSASGSLNSLSSQLSSVLNH